MENVPDFAPPLPDLLAHIAARLANERIPVAVIARALRYPSSDVRESLQVCLDVGGIAEMPTNDWPPTAKRADHLPAAVTVQSEDYQLFACQRLLHLTRLEASFMVVLIRRDEADKDTLHRVIEAQRALRRTRPDSQEMTDPKMVDVVICKLRKKLSALGVKVKTLWGHGYYLEDADRAKVKELIRGEADETNSPTPDASGAAFATPSDHV